MSTLVTISLVFESDDKIAVGMAATPLVLAAIETGALQHVSVQDYEPEEEQVEDER